MRTLSDLEQRTLSRIQSRGNSLQAALDAMTAGPPVDGTVRSRNDTDVLYRIQDPAFIKRIQDAGPFLTAEEKAAENRRSERAGGFKVF